MISFHVLGNAGLLLIVASNNAHVLMPAHFSISPQGRLFAAHAGRPSVRRYDAGQTGCTTFGHKQTVTTGTIASQ